MIDPARLCIALAPLAMYLLVLGAVNLSRRPLVTTGGRDLLALGLGLAGFVMIGPIELLTSTSVVLALGPAYWALALGLYVAVWVLITTYARPRLVIYNVRDAELATALEAAARRVDPQAHWVGHSLLLPAEQAQFTLETYWPLNNVSVVEVGEHASPACWRDLDWSLREQLGAVRVFPAGHGIAFVIVGVVMLLAMSYQWIRDAQAVTRGLREMLGMG